MDNLTTNVFQYVEWSLVTSHDLGHEKKYPVKSCEPLCILSIQLLSVYVSSGVIMIGLIIYAIFVATGLVVSSILFSYYALQAIRTRRTRFEDDFGLNDLSSQIV